MFQRNPENPTLAPNLISRIRHGLHRFLKQELNRAGLPGMVPSHGLILGCLYSEDHLPMNRIARLIGRRKSTLTVLADKLENRGYIQRGASAEDNRVRQVSLTAKGEEAVPPSRVFPGPCMNGCGGDSARKKKARPCGCCAAWPTISPQRTPPGPTMRGTTKTAQNGNKVPNAGNRHDRTSAPSFSSALPDGRNSLGRG